MNDFYRQTGGGCFGCGRFDRDRLCDDCETCFDRRREDCDCCPCRNTGMPCCERQRCCCAEPLAIAAIFAIVCSCRI